MPARFFLFLSGTQEIAHLFQLHDRPVVLSLQCPFRVFPETHICDQDDLLPEMVKGDDLVKEHQIHIFKCFGILCLCPHRGFAVSEIIIGEISYQSSGKGGKILKSRALMIREDLAEIPGRVVCPEPDAACIHLPVHAGDLHLRVISKKGISAPFFIRLR